MLSFAGRGRTPHAQHAASSSGVETEERLGRSGIYGLRQRYFHRFTGFPSPKFYGCRWEKHGRCRCRRLRVHTRTYNLLYNNIKCSLSCLRINTIRHIKTKKRGISSVTLIRFFFSASRVTLCACVIILLISLFYQRRVRSVRTVVCVVCACVFVCIRMCVCMCANTNRPQSRRNAERCTLATDAVCLYRRNRR